MRVLVLGGSGFIGKNLVPLLRKRGHDPVVDDVDTGLVDWSKCDACVNLAAIPGVAACEANREAAHTVNVTLALKVLQKFAGKRVVFISSAAVERLDSFYGATKRAAELYCAHYDNVVVLRLTNVYGPHSEHKHSVVHKMIRATLQGKRPEIHGDGKQWRDFVYVEKVCEVIANWVDIKRSFVAYPGQLTGNPVSVGSGQEPVSIAKLAYLIGVVSDGQVDHEHPELCEGLRKTYEWYRERVTCPASSG